MLPGANSVSPINLIMPISLLAKTLIPSSSIRSEDIENKRGAGEEDPLPAVVRRPFDRGVDLSTVYETELEVWKERHITINHTLQNT